MNPPEGSATERTAPVGGPAGVSSASEDGKDGSAVSDPFADPGAERRRRRLRFIVETLAIVVVAVLVALVLRVFVVQTFYVPSQSMEPTIDPGDRILVDKLSYHFHAIHRGDIVVFSRPPAEVCGGPPVPDLVKRVIGLPGDRIASRGNSVLIDGKPLAEPWLPVGEPLGKQIAPATIPPNDYYVMGDNRPESCDSRYWGVVPRSLIVGKVVAIFWPFSRLHWF